MSKQHHEIDEISDNEPIEQAEKIEISDEEESSEVTSKRKLTTTIRKKPAVSSGTVVNYNPFDTNTISDSLKLPLARVKKIIREDKEFKSGSLEAYQLITKATELFIQSFSTDCYNVAAREKRVNVHYKDCASMVSIEDRYEFLSDVVPKPMQFNKVLLEQRKMDDMQ
ncbi:hypothetical protein K502DRAFT_344469 [Neoconidiobolus thromboides FSU 785]|nr:hypothetical protein K502DRAFT_344469 [Neoconidiobolus thromboides FSU 785]